MKDRIAAMMNLEIALDSDDVERIERAVQPVLNSLGQDVHGPLGGVVKALGRHARRERIRKNVANVAARVGG